MRLSRASLAILPAAGLLAAALIPMWPYAASTADLVTGTHIVDDAYAAQQPRMVTTPQVLPTPAKAAARKRIPGCAYEDGSGGPLPCRWDAAHMGNGVGLSFNVYPAGERAHGVQPVKYVYDDGHTETGTI